MSDDFPSNSHTQKSQRRERQADSEPSDEKAVVRVTRSKARLRKKSLRKRFSEAFTGDGSQGVGEYIIFEMLVPGIRDAVAEAGIGAIERVAYGADAPRNRRRSGGGGGGYTSYNRMSDARPRGRRDRDEDRRPTTRRRSSDIPEIVLETRVEAEEVVDNMFELLSKYDVVTVRDLLGMVGESHSTTDEDWGWLDLRGARAHKVRGGYLLDLPRPEALD